MEVHWERPPATSTQPHLAALAQFPAAEPAACAELVGQGGGTGQGGSLIDQDTLLHQEAWTGQNGWTDQDTRTDEDAWTDQEDDAEQGNWVVWVAEDDWPESRDGWSQDQPLIRPRPADLIPSGPAGQPSAHDSLALKSPRHAIRRASGQLEPQHAAPRAPRPGLFSRRAAR